MLSSVLVKIQTETEVGYKSQLRIPTSGNTVYSASDFGPHNDKSHDPRSAIKPYIHRSGNRAPKTDASWWRSNGIPPTPSRQPDPFFNAGAYATPTPVAPHQYGLHQQHMTGAAQPPPPFMLPNSGSSGFNDSRSFTTADERMIAEFAHSRDAKRSEANPKVPSASQQVDATIQDPFSGGRTPHNGQARNSSAIKPGRHGQGHDPRVGRPQANYDAQWQGHGRVAPAPVYPDNFTAGIGNTYGATVPYNHQGQQPSYATGPMAAQLPSPETSLHASHHGFTQAREIRRQQGQVFALRSPPSYNTLQSRRNHAHPRPVQNTSNNPLHSGQKLIPRSGSPMKHSQSMPIIQQLSDQFAAQRIHAPNTDAKADSENKVSEWFDKTPQRDTFALAKQSPGTKLTVETSANPGQILEEAPSSASLADKITWHKLRAEKLEIEIKLAEASGHSASKKQYLLLRHHRLTAAEYEIELNAAYKKAQTNSGDLAESTVNHPPTSPGTPHNSEDWPTKAHDSTVESDMISPEIDEQERIQRSASKNREGKATYISEKVPRRRGNVEKFSSAFNERSTSTTEERVIAYGSNIRASHTHGHPPQRAVASPTYGQHDSCAEDQQCNEGDRYHYEYSHNDNISDFASQAGASEDDGEVLSPRGRGYQHQHAHPGRYASQMSYNGGMGLWHGPQQK